MNCRFCATPLGDVFLDLGTAPPSNAFLSAVELQQPETWFPLRLRVCDACRLVQLEEAQDRAQLFTPEYVYHSSYSRSWLVHAERYVEGAVQRLGLGPHSRVVEVASNDGYLLQYVAARGIPCIGIEPTAGTAQVARQRGITTVVEFLGAHSAARFSAEYGTADLVVGNNVFAHVPDLNDFVAGLALLLAPQGTLTLEFPHLLQLVEHRQFDTVYHEHYSYFSFDTAVRVLAAHGLRVYDVERLDTHGGSLRLWACLAAAALPGTASLAELQALEQDAGMRTAAYYRNFQAMAESVKNDFLEFLLAQKRLGKRIAGYGAAAKGNTLLNFSGVRADLVAFVADASPHKQGRYLPGSRIPVVAEAELRAQRPDFVVVFPWNLRREITAQLEYVREWGGHLVFAVPRLEVA